MFTKSKTTKYSYLRRLSILPILAATVLLFAFRNGTMNSRPIVKLDKQYTVIIDAGHGGEDLGASAADGTTEKDLALAIALKVKSLNNNPNIKIILSRETDKFITVMDRTNFANSTNADIFLSIHMDNDDTKKGTGATCYVPFKKNLYINESTVLAKNLLSSTNELFPKSTLITTKDRGIWVIENANMPAVLFESGFISNPNDLKLVKANEEKIANMLLVGINAYLANKEQSNSTSNLEKPNNIDGVKIKEGAASPAPLTKSAYYLDSIKMTKKGHVGNLQNKVNDVTVIGYGNSDQDDKSEIVIFNAPKIQKNTDPTKNNDPIFYTAEKPAEFPGGPKGWTNYLMNNLDRDLPVKNKAVTGKYTIKLNFLVNKDGGVENVVAENNPGYGTADEAIRVIEKGPKWIPAEQNGKKVNYLMKQVIVFDVAGK